MTIKNDITDQIDQAIGGMAQPTFNYDYDNVNQLKPASKTYPAVETTYLEEEYDDPDDGQVVDSYSANLQAIFKVTVDDTDDVQLGLAKVLQDFQRLLEDEHANLQAKGMLVADLDTVEREYTQIRKRPGRITMAWVIQYRVKRSDPSQTT